MYVHICIYILHMHVTCRIKGLQKLVFKIFFLNEKNTKQSASVKLWQLENECLFRENS